MHRSVIASFFAVGALGEEIPGMENIDTKCRQVVSDLGQQGLSDQQIAAFCRAAYSPDMCRAMRSGLGSQPWSQERVTSACQGWQDLVLPKLMAMPEDRRAVTLSDVQDTLDQTTRAKGLVGINLPKDAGGRVDMEATLLRKAQLSKQWKKAWDEYNGVEPSDDDDYSEVERSITLKYGDYTKGKQMREAVPESPTSQQPLDDGTQLNPAAVTPKASGAETDGDEGELKKEGEENNEEGAEEKEEDNLDSSDEEKAKSGDEDTDGTQLNSTQRLYGEHSSIASTHSIASSALGVSLVSLMAMAAVMTTRYLRRTPDVMAETSLLEEPTSPTSE